MSSLVAVGAMVGAVAPALAQTPPPPAIPAGVVAQAQPQPQAQPQAVITDEAITSTIKAKLESNKITRNIQVTIASTNGFVTLVGTVPTQFARDDVLEAARSTPGVVRIDDQLRFEITSPSAPARSN